MTANISDDIPMHFYCRSFRVLELYYVLFVKLRARYQRYWRLKKYRKKLNILNILQWYSSNIKHLRYDKCHLNVKFRASFIELKKDFSDFINIV